MSGAVCAAVLTQSGESGSVTFTLVRATLPSLVTVIVKPAVEPVSIVWLSGVLATAMCGYRTTGFSWFVAESTAGHGFLPSLDGLLFVSPEYSTCQWKVAFPVAPGPIALSVTV